MRYHVFSKNKVCYLVDEINLCKDNLINFSSAPSLAETKSTYSKLKAFNDT